MERRLTQEQFAPARALLESTRRRTRPRVHDLYNVFSAVLYLLDSGVAWRSLPPEYPPWRTVHEYFTQWTLQRENGRSVLEHALELAGQQDLIPQLHVKMGKTP